MAVPIPSRRLAAAAVLAVVALAAAACGDDSNTKTAAATTGASSASSATLASSSPGGSTATSGSAASGPGGGTIAPDRCAQNKAAGTITYLSGFDFAASASIVDVVMAKAQGFYDQLCLDVALKPSFSTENFALVAAGRAQFASAGSYTEVLQHAADGGGYVVVTEEGHTGIDALLAKPDQIKTVADVKGKRLGVLGGLPASVQAMLAAAGLHEGKDFTTVQLDGFDPVAHFRLDIAGRPGFKSNEPGILQRAGVPFTLLDPGAQGIPGSFGIVFSSQSFVKDHPTAAQDFVRATLKGLAAAIADPDAAVQACMKLIDTAGNQNHLTEEGERFRWQTESKLVVSSTPKNVALGAVDAPGLEAEVTAYTGAGVFTARPSTTGTYDAGLAAGLYDAEGNLRWPT